jgi:nitrite reductase/ring-hydroxylating ferredoxin subunit
MTVAAPGIRVAALDEVPSDRCLIVTVDGIEVGLVRDGDEFYAVRNLCPHQSAPICQGRVAGTMLPSQPGVLNYGLDRRVLICPWHQFEFDLETGRPLFTNFKGRIRTYRVTVADDNVYVHAGASRGNR